MVACILQVIAGLWLMVSPSVLDISGRMSDNIYICAPLIITMAVVAMWEINSNVIRANIVIGAWLLITLLTDSWDDNTSFVLILLPIVLVVLTSFLKRSRKEQFGGGWKSLFQKYPAHLQATQNDELRGTKP